MPDTELPATYRAPRLFVEAPLAAGAVLPLSREQARYLFAVLRRKPGAAVLLFNGRDGEWAAFLRQTGRDAGLLELAGQTRPPATDAGPWLLFAAIKRTPTELIVEKATELGVSRFLPVRTERSNQDRINHDRLTRIAIEAAEQSERLDVPAIEALQPLPDALADWPRDRLLIVGDETGTAPPMREALTGARPGPFGLLVGPEGGFAQGELDGLGQLDFVAKVGFGPRVLRAETAALVGLALGQAILGDFAKARPVTR